MIEWQGKNWIRLGECNRCGECCFGGFVKPCPHIRQQPDYTVLCAIYDRRSERNDPEALEIARVQTTACDKWPCSPGDFLTSHPGIRNRCGYVFVEAPKILLACPTHQSKEYAMRQWIDAVKAITYPVDIFVVDNSPNMDLANRWGAEIPITHIDVEIDHPMIRMCRSMEVIREHFLAGTWTHWLNIEADVIVPPNVVEVLLKIGGDADWISHGYPSRHPNSGDDPEMEALSGIGCSLLSRRMIQECSWAEAGHDGPDCWLWHKCRASKKFKASDNWGHMRLKHLAGG